MNQDTYNPQPEQSQQNNTPSLPEKPLTKEQVKKMTDQEWGELVDKGMIASLNNPDNHGKTR